MLRTVVVLTAAAALGGCAVAPGYGYGQPYGDADYGYAPSYYAPAYGSVSVWAGGGGGYYRGRDNDQWRGGHPSGGGHWNAGGHGGNGHGGGGRGGGGGHGH